MILNTAYLAACYLLGAIPTGYWVGRALRGIDIRQHGSGNLGATNVFRVLGTGPGAFVLLFDIGKGWAAAGLLPGYFGIEGNWVLGGALAAVLGHNYTCFLNFKGGKGVATSAGVIAGLAPLSFLTVLAAFVAVFAAGRMVSLGSLVGAAILPGALWYYKEGGWPLRVLGLAIAVFIWVRHIPNLKRIMAGTENKFGKKP